MKTAVVLYIPLLVNFDSRCL